MHRFVFIWLFFALIVPKIQRLVNFDILLRLSYMLTEYILKQLAKARYKLLDDKSYFGEILGLRGVWASHKTLEGCREELREVLEEWLLLKLSDGDDIPGLPLTTKKIHSVNITRPRVREYAERDSLAKACAEVTRPRLRRPFQAEARIFL